MAKRPAIVFVESIDTGIVRPAHLNAKTTGPEVWHGKVFHSLNDVLALEDEDLHSLARETGCEITSKKDTAELLWFRANKTQSIYLGPHSEKEKRDMAKSSAVKRVRKTKTAAVAGDGRGRPSELKGKKIYVKATENPRRKGSIGHKSFALMKNGQLVEEFIAAGGRLVDLRWELAHKHVEVK